MRADIGIVIADDHSIVRKGLREVIASDSRLTILAEAEDGESACRLYDEVHPDVLVMDISMPGMGGVEAVRRIIAHDRRARILALSAHEDTSHPKRVLKAGALGYLCKRGAPEALIDAIRATAKGQRYLDAQIAQRMAMQDLSGNHGPLEVLSEREFEVFLQLARGQTVAQIADKLNLSSSTVGTHLYNIKQKLNVVNQAELTLLAVRHKLIET